MNTGEFFEAGGPLSRVFGTAYTERDQQVELAKTVSRALDSEEPLLADAPTGTGKSQGYLVPLALSGKKAVISTGTIALQHQLVEKDLPALRKACEEGGIEPPSAALLKGRSNFLCQRRFAEYGESMHIGEEDAFEAVNAVFAKTTSKGDKAELETIPTFWADIASDGDDCAPARCSHRSACFFYRHKDGAVESDILVVNHALLAANLAAGGQVFDMSDRHLIIDEAHKIEDTLMGSFGAHVTYYRVRYVARMVSRKIHDSEGLRDSIERAAEDFFGELEQHKGLGPGSEPPSYEALHTGLQKLHMLAKTNPAQEVNELAPAVYRLMTDLGWFYRLLEETHAYGIVRNGKSLELKSWLIEPSEVFGDMVLGRKQATILTSATLAVGGSFDYIRDRLGFADDVTEHYGGEVFDYARNALVYVARGMPNPTRQEAQFLGRGVEVVRELVEASRGRALVLLATHKALRYYRDNLDLDGYPVRFQGDAPPMKLVEWLRDSPNGVLVATRTFFEGVDVPGEALSLVVMDKAPFPHLGDPVIKALCDKAGSGAFRRVSLPRALMTLQQGAGRLIRSHEDRGVIAILDSRVAQSNWGAQALKSLPEGAPLTASIGDVAAFFETDKEGAA